MSNFFSSVPDCVECKYVDECPNARPGASVICDDYNCHLIWDCQDCEYYTFCGCPAGPAFSVCFEKKTPYFP